MDITNISFEASYLQFFLFILQVRTKELRKCRQDTMNATNSNQTLFFFQIIEFEKLL